MATQVNIEKGVIIKITGQVNVVVDGVKHPLKAGDIVSSNDKIESDDGSAVKILMIDGSLVDLKEDSTFDMRDYVLAPHQHSLPSAEAIQNAVFKGVSPEDISDAIFSGEALENLLPAEGGFEAHYVDWGHRGLVESGFPTGPIGFEIKKPEDEFIFLREKPVIEQISILPNIPSDLPEGSLGNARAEVYEDAMPAQNTGDFSIDKVPLVIPFTPADNEVIVSVTIFNIPDLAKIEDGTQSIMGNGSNSITVLAANLPNLKFIQAPNDSDHDYDLQYSVVIKDPDSGLQNTLDGSMHVVTDAVADLPNEATGRVTNQEEHEITSGFAYSIGGQEKGEEGHGSVLYKINLATGEVTAIGMVAVDFGNGESGSNLDVEAMDLNPADGFLYALVTSTGNNQGLIKVNPETAETTFIGSTPTSNLAGFAFDNNGVLYAAVGNADSKIYTVNLSNGNFTELGTGDTGKNIGGLAISDDGQLVGIGSEGSTTKLYFIDNAGHVTGEVTVNDVPQNADLQSLDFDEAGNLWAVDRVTGEIYAINGETGDANKISQTLPAHDQTSDGFESLAIVAGTVVECIDNGEEAQFSLSAHFGDYIDGSENHFFLLEIKTEEGWSAPDGATVVDGALYGLSGDYLLIEANGSANPVVAASLFTPSDLSEDTAYQLKFYAVAEEVNLSGEEIRTDNNFAIISGGEIDVLVCQDRADVSIDKSVDDATPDINQVVTYTLVIHVSGEDAKNVVVTDKIPAGLVVDPYSLLQSGGEINGDTITWHLGDVEAGQDITLHYNATVTSNVDFEEVENIAHVISDTPDPTLGNNTDNEIIDPQDANLKMEKSVDDTTPNNGQLVTFTLTVTNNGHDDATGVSVDDLLPAGLVYQSDDGNGAYVGGVWTIGNLANGASATLHIVALVDGTVPDLDLEEIKNTSTVTSSDVFDPDLTDNTDDASVDPQDANLKMEKSVDDATPDNGQLVTFTLTVTNNGHDDATGVSVDDLLPAGLVYQSDDGNGAYVGGVWTIGNLANGASATLHIVALVDGTVPDLDLEEIKNTSTVTSSDVFDPDLTDNTDDASVDPQDIDLALDKSVNNSTPNVGENIVFTLTLSNAGNDTATNIVVKDVLPAGLEFVSASSGSYDELTHEWSIPSLEANSQVQLQITATVMSSVYQGVTNEAEVIAVDQFDPDSLPDDGQGDDYDNVFVNPKDADLSLTKASDKSNYVVGETITYTINLHNNGADTATAVQVEDAIPAGVTFVSAVAEQGIFSAGVWNVGNIASGDTLTLTITGTVNKEGSITNNAEVIVSAVFDPDSIPNDGQGDDYDFVTVVADEAKKPTVDLVVNTIDDAIKEDTQASVTISANTIGGTDDILTQVVVSNLPSGVDFSGLSLILGVTSVTFVAGVLTINLDPSQNITSFSGNILVTPPTNSDLDINSVFVTATAADGSDPSVTATSDPQAFNIVVDAVADPVTVGISVQDSSGNGLFAANETGTLSVDASFGDFSDNSEKHTVEVHLVSGFTATLASAGTLGGASYTYNSATGVIIFTVPNLQSSLNVDISITAPSVINSSNLVFTAQATADENPASDSEFDGTDNIATASAQTGIPVERLLDGALTTNTNSHAGEFITLTFVQTDNPLHASAKMYDLNLQGQQGTVVQDAGFNIDPAKTYYVTLEASKIGYQAILTNVSLEGVSIVDQGNVKLELDDTSNTSADSSAVTDVITPATPAVHQGQTLSTDGTSANQTLTDSTANTFNYLYGGSGNDQLNGSSGADILNGGLGNDKLVGGAGNDILVYDAADVTAGNIDGGAGTDVLRIDQGAVFISDIQTSGGTPGANLEVDLRGNASVVNMEVILFTEEINPDASVGTTIKLNAQDVLNFTDANNTLYIVGSDGDKVQIDGANWIDGDAGAPGINPTGTINNGDGQIFNTYQTLNGGTLHVDQDVQVISS